MAVFRRLSGKSMDFKQVEIFINIMRYGTFAEASKHLGMTPSQIRAGIATLEQEAGVQLYHPDPSGELEMTVAGQRFFRESMSIVRIMEQTLRALEECSPADCVRVAARPAPGAAFLPGVAAAFRLRRPEIRVRLDILDNDQIIHEISEGKYDVGLVRPLPSMDIFMLQHHRAWRDRLCVVAPDTPPYRSLPSVLSLSALGELPLIIHHPAAPEDSSPDPSPETLLTAPPSPGKPPLLDLSQNPPVLSGNHDETIVRMAAEGLGAALVPISLTRRISGVRVLELEGIESLPQFHMDYYAIYPRAEYRLPHMAEFLELIPPLEPVSGAGA
jgi:DNA-binding transcriptional LysR family regulator